MIRCSGIGRRLDGWANTDLDVGAIVALSPVLDEATKAEFRTWGPGKYDPRHHYFDGTNIVSLPMNSPSLPVVTTDLRIEGVGFEDLHGRRTDLVLEQLCRRRTDGRTWKLQRSARRHCHLTKSRSSDATAPALLDYQLRLRAPQRQEALIGWPRLAAELFSGSAAARRATRVLLYRRVERARQASAVPASSIEVG